MKEENKKKGNVPNLRFPQFTEEWKSLLFGDIATIKGGFAFDAKTLSSERRKYQIVKMGNLYQNQLNLDRTPSFIDIIDNRQCSFLLKKNDIAITLTGTNNKRDYGYSHLFKSEDNLLLNQRCALIRAKYDSYFLSYLIKTSCFLEQFFQSSAGGTGNQANVSTKDIESFIISVPKLKEQEKIGKFLSLIDERIETQNKIIEDLKLLKSTIRHTLFTQIDKSNHKAKRIKYILDYEQPTKYIVENVDYQNDVSLIPVLTANKAFVLGYTSENYGIYDKGDCIIFDDFTMDLKYVNFPFKVKSSAIKILTSKSNVNLKYIFEYLSFLDLTSNDHKRHYISEVESMPIYVPEVEMQNIFSNLFSVLDEKIVLESHHYNLLIAQKQYLLSQLFI
ncbi:restriction endonuclease subunit S [Porphyromonas pogonae]|uniref:restriction endonuclease subunit S n=1 Tax=Porphyromonas pogonae TaxID=867595 RepID=UPI002E76C31A|nr:restriction endonuclease subunit S [Porphyromonas pogonae]